jgi:hypothetical protein
MNANGSACISVIGFLQGSRPCTCGEPADLGCSYVPTLFIIELALVILVLGRPTDVAPGADETVTVVVYLLPAALAGGIAVKQRTG